MTEPIDLAAERDKREQPDPQFVRQDDYGRKLFLFLLSYEMGGSRWCAEVWAYDFDDAATRVAAMRGSLTLDGQAFETVPA